ncbi:MAG: CRISPR-associated helicase Cas3' [Bacteroidota bacterium]
MKSFKSFKELIEKASDLLENLDNTYLAHISEAKKDETLKEHTELVKAYALSIIEQHNLDNIVDHITYEIVRYFSNIEHLGNLIKELFINTIVYHDLGKINPNFQVKKMNNPNLTENKSLKIKHYHSFLGTYILQNFYYEKILNKTEITEEEKILPYYIVTILTNAINKHHSSYIKVKKEFEEDEIKEIFPFLNSYEIQLDENISLSFYSNFKELEETFKYQLPNFDYFLLFTLLKLNYSLLTASDYYATSEYMNNLQITDFGIIDKNLRQRIVSSFINNEDKPYNKNLIEYTEKNTDILFENLQERNNRNLNILRQKLASEAILNLRKNSGQNLFYLEAPTGGGKTNISIAFATELLKLDESLSNIFYVFPFTTLVDQTFQSIKDTIDVKDDEIIQLHSKAGFPSKNTQEGEYGSNYKNYIDYLFVNYPITILTHIRFFDILKGNSKGDNYLLHRLANSIVIIDELQSYPPTHWDKIIYFLDNYAKLFNIKILIMSATLPKIDELNEGSRGKIVDLITNRDQYFLNPNFGNRVTFEYISWNKPKSDEDKKEFLKNLSSFIYDKSEEYAKGNDNKVRTVVEFISKKTASEFLKVLNKTHEFSEYKIYLISGEILESRRKEIIDKIKNNEDDKIVVATTQVIEAGVDIDMDIGFKDRSLIDSEEQLAGRINREATKRDCTLYIFDLDMTKNIYGRDYRYDIQTKDEWIDKNYLKILKEKNYHELYQRVNQILKKELKDDFNQRNKYRTYFKNLNLHDINIKFKLIDQDTKSLFIPLKINSRCFNQSYIEALGISIDDDNTVSGEKVFEKYIELVENKEADFTSKKIDLKKMAGIMSQYIISVFPNQLDKIKEYKTLEEKYGYEYLINWQDIYSYHSGFDMDKIKEDIFI